MKMKKTLALILAFAMIMSTMSFTAFAEETAVANIGGVPYDTVAAALDAVADGETITLNNVIGDESNLEIDFEKDVDFTITGEAPDYALPVVTFIFISPSHFTSFTFILPVETARSRLFAVMFSILISPVESLILISFLAKA